MRKPALPPLGDSATIPPLPGWISAARPESPEEAAFLAGAALAHLHLGTRAPGLPTGLWRARLALMAAEAAMIGAGRPERAAALRDAFHLTRPGDHPGPAGAVLRDWTRAVARPISVANLARALPGMDAARIALCLDAGAGAPVARAAAVLEAVFADAPRADVAALILAEAALARAVGWDHVTPLLAPGLRPRDLRLRGEALLAACHRAIVIGAGKALPLAADMTRRAARLQAVAPKLRAKGAGAAVNVFLTSDALAPTALTPVLSDRAARRLCDRLVALQAIRELTGRDSFRLYGL